MKRILIILVAVLLLVGGAFGGITVFMPGLLGKKAPETEAVAPPEPAPPLPLKPTVVKMTTIDVPLVIDGVLNRQIHFTISLIVAPEALPAVQAALPRLRNDIIQFAYDAFPRQYAEHGKMDLPRLKVSLAQIARRILGASAVKDILLQSYFEI